MKDHEFLELLNLYLDHEITAEDAARLEAEVQANPNRRRVYRDYCRMQKACTMLAKDFADQPADSKVIALEPRRSAWGPGLFATGGLALAAACVALVLVNRARTAAPETPVSRQEVAVAKAPAAEVQAPPATEASIQIAHAVTVPARRNEVRPVLASVPLMLAGTSANNNEALLASTQQSTAPAQFEWMRTVQLAPIQTLQADELRVDSRSPLQPATRTYGNGRAPVQGNVDWVAFKFQR